MLECARCGADRSGVASGEPCPKCGEASGGAEAASAAPAGEPAAPDAGGEGRAPVEAGDWVDDTSPDSEERLKPADLEAWRRKTAGSRDAPPVRQPPPGLKPSRRLSTAGGRGSAVHVPLPPPMDFTPAPELVSEATPPPELTKPENDLRATAPSLPTHLARAATPRPAAADIPDLTDEIDPQPAPAVWKEAHPSARRWAEKRKGTAGVSAKRAPSMPRVVLGILIAALGAWLVLSFLPDRKPLTAAERARVEKQAGIDSNAWRFGQAGYMAARGAAALYITLGILVALRGLFFRRRVEAACHRCGRTVTAERSGLQLRCEGGPHAAGINSSAVALLVAFAVLSLALVALIAIASLGK
jgi:hypothetical protein